MTLKQQAIAYIEQLSTEKLKSVLDYLAYLQDKEDWEAIPKLETDLERKENRQRTQTDVKAGKSESRHNEDPLLALAGTLECDEENISERHDEYIGDALLAKLAGNADE